MEYFWKLLIPKFKPDYDITVLYEGSRGPRRPGGVHPQEEGVPKKDILVHLLCPPGQGPTNEGPELLPDPSAKLHNFILLKNVFHVFI